MSINNVVFLLLLRFLVAYDLNFSVIQSNATNINNLEEIEANNEISFGSCFLLIFFSISNSNFLNYFQI